MTDTVSLSVIIPTFRREQQLGRAVTSALADDIAGLEVLVIDDSPEHSAREAISALNDDRVRYLAMPSPSGGVPALVRNFGIEQSRGEVLYFLDDDDAVVAGGLGAFLEAFDEQPDVGVVFGRVLCEGPDVEVRQSYQRWFDWAAKTSRRLRRSTRLTVGVILFRGTVIINSCCAVRRSVALEQGGYDPAVEVYEDVDFFMRSMRSSGHAFLDVPVLHYRTGEPSIIHDLKGNNDLIAASYRTMRANYRARNGLAEYSVLRVLSKLLPVGSPYVADAA